ncbi:MAG: M1 family aminopeptidase [Anaerolineae bacterium]|nr:M1 family aminopeptidase [Anaerolineae bacterium]
MTFLNHRGRLVLLLSSLLISLLPSACSSAKPHPANPLPAIPTVKFNIEELPSSPTFPATSTPFLQQITVSRPLYTLDASLDYLNHQLDITQSIAYTNLSSDALNELLIIIEPHRIPNTFELISLKWHNIDQLPDFTLDAGILRVQTINPIRSGERRQINIIYQLKLPAQSGIFGYTPVQANLTNWYPFIPPYQSGIGWLVYQPAQVGEYWVYDSADFDVAIHLDDPDLVIAAPSPAIPIEHGFRYQLQAARSFSWAVSQKFEVLTAHAGDIPVFAYVFPTHRTAGAAALDAAQKAIPIFQDLFGDYPYESLSLIELDYHDGYESDGLFFLGQKYFYAPFASPQNYLTTLSVHETAHQWWCALVGSDQAIEPWLDEALSTYSELLFYENQYPDMVDWWWEFRINRFSPTGFVNSTIYDFDDPILYTHAVYLRGALFLHSLRQHIGDKAFFTSLRQLAALGSQRHITTEDFFAIISQNNPQDISPLLAEYFNTNNQ